MIDLRLVRDEVPAGGAVEAQILWTPHKQTQPKKAIAKLQWRTEGRGSSDTQVVEQIQLDTHLFTRGVPSQIPIRLSVPSAGPISYNGSLIRIIWEVSLYVDLPGLFNNDRETQVVYVVPR